MLSLFFRCNRMPNQPARRLFKRLPINRLKRVRSVRFIGFLALFVYVLYIADRGETYLAGHYTFNIPSFVANTENPYVINNVNACKENANTSSIIVVHSASQHSFIRATIRNTWGNSSYLKQYSMKLLFFLGKPSIPHVQQRIIRENKINGDIIQGSFLDTYKNLTHKAVSVLRWISEHCMNVKSVIKVDDDVFLNIPITHRTVSNFASNQILCDVHRKGDLESNVIHRYNSKWDVSILEFSNHLSYPFNFCAGYLVIMQSKLIEQLYAVSKLTPFFWIDDVFVYGILAEKTGNVVYRKLKSIAQTESLALECLRNGTEMCRYIGVLTSEVQTIYTLWEMSKLSD